MTERVHLSETTILASPDRAESSGLRKWATKADSNGRGCPFQASQIRLPPAIQLVQFGLCLDLAEDNVRLGWGLGFGHLALVTLAGLAVLRSLRD